jgi:hypothetical protein
MTGINSPRELTDEMKNHERYTWTEDAEEFDVLKTEAHESLDVLMVYMYAHENLHGDKHNVLKRIFDDFELWIEGYFDHP